MTDTLPFKLGAVARIRPLALAEKAIALSARLSENAKKKFIVTLDCAGIAWVERPSADNVPSEIAATFNRKSDPDWLAEEIEFAGRAFA